MVLCNSFWGLERAICSPPNIVLTGPLSKPQNDLLTKLEEKDVDLFNWLNSSDDPVVYVSLGTLVKFQEWSRDAVYYALKRLGCRVVWSMKNLELPEENERFWVRPWLP